MSKSNEIKISFIIPVYNSDKYLNKCIDSILNQSYKNFEIILVDDGSSDLSPSICDYYQNNYKNVKTIHKKNGGVASARNIGIKESSGDYLFFIDNDDWINSSELINSVKTIEDSKADLLINRYYIVDNDKKCLGNGFINSRFIKNKKSEEVLKYFRKNRINIMTPWAYVVKRSIVLENNIFFNSLQNGIDDSVFSPRLFCNCKSFAIGEEPIYYWRQSDNSQGRSHKKRDFMEKNFSTINDFIFLAEKFRKTEREKYIYFCMYKNMFSFFQFFNQYSVEEKKKIKKFIIKNKKDIKKSVKYSGVFHQILFYLFGSFYGLLLSYKAAKLKGWLYDIIYKIK